MMIYYPHFVQIIAAHMESEFDRKNPVLSYVGFMSIMCSSWNDGYSEKRQRLHQDASLPLSCYYMASSHNTYLEGDQLTSASSVNRWVRTAWLTSQTFPTYPCHHTRPSYMQADANGILLLLGILMTCVADAAALSLIAGMVTTENP